MITNAVMASNFDGDHSTNSNRQVYQRLESELEAVEQDTLIALDTDVERALVIVRDHLGEILTFGDRLSSELPGVDRSAFDKLRDYASATAYAQSQYRLMFCASGELQSMHHEALELREVLYSAAASLRKRGLINGTKLAYLRGSSDCAVTAFELLLLADTLRPHWRLVSRKSGLTSQMLDRESAIAEELQSAASARASGLRLLTGVILDRQRAFTLLVRAYDQVRRCIHFMRWSDGDAEEIAPSLLSPGRGRSIGSDLAPRVGTSGQYVDGSWNDEPDTRPY